jgi:hypothetical protein
MRCLAILGLSKGRCVGAACRQGTYWRITVSTFVCRRTGRLLLSCRVFRSGRCRPPTGRRFPAYRGNEHAAAAVIRNPSNSCAMLSVPSVHPSVHPAPPIPSDTNDPPWRGGDGRAGVGWRARELVGMRFSTERLVRNPSYLRWFSRFAGPCLPQARAPPSSSSAAD